MVVPCADQRRMAQQRRSAGWAALFVVATLAVIWRLSRARNGSAVLLRPTPSSGMQHKETLDAHPQAPKSTAPPSPSQGMPAMSSQTPSLQRSPAVTRAPGAAVASATPHGSPLTGHSVESVTGLPPSLLDTLRDVVRQHVVNNIFLFTVLHLDAESVSTRRPRGRNPRRRVETGPRLHPCISILNPTRFNSAHSSGRMREPCPWKSTLISVWPAQLPVGVTCAQHCDCVAFSLPSDNSSRLPHPHRTCYAGRLCSVGCNLQHFPDEGPHVAAAVRPSHIRRRSGDVRIPCAGRH